MNKFALSLIALAALSTTALANDRTEEGTVASRNVYNGAVWANEPIANNEQASFAVQDSSAVSDFARMKLQGIEHDSGDGH